MAHRVGWRCRAPYEWGEHVDIAKRNGVTAVEVERVTAGAYAPGWTAHEMAILRGVDELIEIRDAVRRDLGCAGAGLG
jgi:hypothetical protein